LNNESGIRKLRDRRGRRERKNESPTRPNHGEKRDTTTSGDNHLKRIKTRHPPQETRRKTIEARQSKTFVNEKTGGVTAQEKAEETGEKTGLTFE